MLRKSKFATWFVSLYLLTYTILLWSGIPLLRQIAFAMFLCAPPFVVWMAYTIIRHAPYSGRELGEDEFGYEDRLADQLGPF